MLQRQWLSKLFHRTHAMPSQIQINPSSSQAHSPIHPKTSDHRGFTYPQQEELIHVLVYNMMMQAKSRKDRTTGQITGFNNGFKIEESAEEYQRRIQAIAQKVQEIIKSDPGIAVIALQEAPINDEDVAHIKQAIQTAYEGCTFDSHKEESFFMDYTQWGVMTVIHAQRLQNATITLDQDFAHAIQDQGIKDLEIRVRTFKIHQSGQTRTLTNLHLPHDAPDVACKLVLKTALQRLLEGDITQKQLHEIVGDWNLHPTRIAGLFEEALHELKQTLPGPLPVAIRAHVYPNMEGHLDSSNRMKSVDALLHLTVEPSEQFRLEFIQKESAHVITSALAAIAIASQLTLAFMDDDEEQTSENDDTSTEELELELSIQKTSQFR